MRAYTAESEEALRARRRLKDWAAEGLLTEEQQQRLEEETVSGLRTTNIYLLSASRVFPPYRRWSGRTVALFFWIILSRHSHPNDGIFYLIFAAVCYGAAESIVHQESLYRHGIEEAFAACSVTFFCWGLEGALFSSRV